MGMERALVGEGSLFYRHILPRSAHGNAAGLVELADHGEAYEALDGGQGGLELPTSPLSGAEVTEDCVMTQKSAGRTVDRIVGRSVRLCTAQPVLLPISNTTLKAVTSPLGRD